jgi:hypothetical protein
MKKFLVLIVVLSSLCVFAQKNNGVFINYSYGKNDSTSNFTIAKVEKDRARELMVKTLGTPVLNEAGNIVWKNVNIAGLANNLTVKLYDGIIKVNNENDYVYTLFKNSADKQDRLSTLLSNSERHTIFEVLDTNEKNIINSKDKIRVVQKMFDVLFEDLQ